MRNGLNIALITLFLVVLGCSCPSKLIEIVNKNSRVSERSTPTASSTPEGASTSATEGEYDVTMAKYNQVRIGMKRSDVERIFGGKGTEYYSGKGGGVSFTSVKWVGEKYKTILVSFRDDKVTSKSQVGLDK